MAALRTRSKCYTVRRSVSSGRRIKETLNEFRSCNSSFVVDSADASLLETAKAELLALIEKPELVGIPLLVLCNKTDLPNAMKAEELVEKLYVQKSPRRAPHTHD